MWSPRLIVETYSIYLVLVDVCMDHAILHPNYAWVRDEMECEAYIYISID